MNQTPVARISELIPREMIVQPFTERARYENIKRFALLVVPTGIGLGMVFSIGVYVWALSWFLATLFFSAGVGLLCLLKLIFDAYEDTRADFRASRDNHTRVWNQVLSIVQSVTIQTVNVKSGAVFNNGTAESVTPGVEEGINDVYSLALEMMRLGVQSWIDNKGKRPKIKVFSAEAITEQFHVGRDRWGEGVQLLADSKVFARPETRTWTPQVKSFAEGEQLLDRYVQSLGYLKNRTPQGRVSWMKK